MPRGKAGGRWRLLAAIAVAATVVSAGCALWRRYNVVNPPERPFIQRDGFRGFTYRSKVTHDPDGPTHYVWRVTGIVST